MVSERYNPAEAIACNQAGIHVEGFRGASRRRWMPAEVDRAW